MNVTTNEFENHRSYLRGVAYRMLGSLSDADDAVQQAWIRLNRSDAESIENLRAWLTTVVARVCLDMMRSREARREEPLESAAASPAATNVEDEMQLANSVGLALLVVLDTLGPAERLSFVLHDVFGMSFEEIAPIVDRSVDATRQLASRARRRVQGQPAPSNRNLDRKREVVDAFLAAARGGDMNALLAILDPEVVIRGTGPDIRGAEVVASRAVQGGARAAQAAIIDGDIGVVVAPRGRLTMVLLFTIEDGKIKSIEAVTDRKRLQEASIAVA